VAVNYVLVDMALWGMAESRAMWLSAIRGHLGTIPRYLLTGVSVLVPLWFSLSWWPLGYALCAACLGQLVRAAGQAVEAGLVKCCCSDYLSASCSRLMAVLIAQARWRR